MQYICNCIHNCSKFRIFTSVDITKYFKCIPFWYVRECPKENSRSWSKPAAVMSGYRMTAELTVAGDLLVRWAPQESCHRSCPHFPSSELVTGSQVRLTCCVSCSQRSKETGPQTHTVVWGESSSCKSQSEVTKMRLVNMLAKIALLSLTKKEIELANTEVLRTTDFILLHNSWRFSLRHSFAQREEMFWYRDKISLCWTFPMSWDSCISIS